MTPTLELDGAKAGGQFLRTALTLSVLEDEPVRIENVRGNRSTPGLGHQHLAVLETMAAVCDADVSGADLGAETVEFDPGPESGADAPAGASGTSIESKANASAGSDEPDSDADAIESAADATTRGDSAGAGSAEPSPDASVASTPAAAGRDGSSPGRLAGGTYEVDVGTAGSVTLLFDALLPLAPILESRLSVTVTGGTDVRWSPSIDYFAAVKLPLLRRFGLEAVAEVDRRGFYPNGGGRATLHLAPSRLRPLDLTERGAIGAIRLYSTESASLADHDVARRQAEGALEALAVDPTGGDDDSGGPPLRERRETTAESASPGSAIVLRVDHEAGVAGFDALGERGTPAERVGAEAASAANRFLEGEAPVDRYLADQVLVFLAVAGGRVRVPAVTDHVATSCDLLEAFGVDLACAPEDGGALVSVDPDAALVGPDGP